MTLVFAFLTLFFVFFVSAHKRALKREEEKSLSREREFVEKIKIERKEIEKLLQEMQGPL